MVYFKEEQKFTQLWLWVLILSIDTLLVGIVLTNLNNLQDFMIAIFLGMVPALIATWLIYSARLQVEIKDQTVYYRFVPFHREWRKIRKHKIEKFEVITYGPIRDYGGWGIRQGFGKGKALNVKGNKGLKIYYANNKPLLLGTQKPDKIARTMEAMMDKKDEDYG